jgi:hypothetical protein
MHLEGVGYLAFTTGIREHDDVIILGRSRGLGLLGVLMGLSW